MILNFKTNNLKDLRYSKNNKLIILSLFSILFFQALPSYSLEENKNSSLIDLDKNHWAYNSINELINKYELKMGYPDQTFKGEHKISRYEIAVLLVQVLQKIKINKEIKLENNEKINLENIKSQYLDELEKIKISIQSLEDQTDIQKNDIDKINEDVNIISKALNFKFFGGLALRNCFMSTNIISEPQNILKNIRGNSFQTRFVAGITGDFIDDFNYQLRVISADSNSFNISWLPFDTNLTRLPISLDRYFIGYQPKIFNKSMKFTIGKSPNFLPETELFFDEDVSFSGLSQQFNFNKVNSWLDNIFIGFTENFLGHQGTFDTSFMFGAKLSGDVSLSDNIKLKVGASYASFPGSQNLSRLGFNQGYLYTTSSKNRFEPNSQNFISTFNLIDSFVKLKYEFSENYPLEIYGDFINNFGAEDKNKGYIFGASLGALKKTGDLFFNYNYKRLEQDYNISFFVQDQMGGTDVFGHQFDFGVQVATKTKLLFTLQNRSSISNPNSQSLYILYSSIRQDF